MILNTMDLGKVKNNQNNGVTLREYFETRMQAIEKAVEVAYTSMDARLEGMNQFRDALRDQAAKFITRDVADKTNCAVTDRTRSLELIKFPELRLEKARQLNLVLRRYWELLLLLA